MAEDALDRAAKALEEAARAESSTINTMGAERATPGLDVAGINVNWKCIAKAVAKYGACRLSGGTNCEQQLFDDVKKC